MEILKIEFENWNSILLHINWVAAVIIVVAIVVLNFLIRLISKKICYRSIQIEQSTIGIGNSTVTISYNYKDIEIAYKVWVELYTRKIGLPIDLDKDVIIEIYSSWYSSFGIIRELLKDIPANKLDGCDELIKLITDVLNNGLRVHLTNWQAEFKTWYEKESKDYKGMKPQDIQKRFPKYKELTDDLLKTNRELIQFTEYMKKIAFKEK